MAKSNSILKIQGTLQGNTFVKSKAYGDHVRAARGTHKPAVVNEALQESSRKIQEANVPAKMLKDALDPYRQHFKGGSLWQRLVSVFRAQLRTTGTIDFTALADIEIHEHYPVSRFLKVTPQVVHDAAANTLRVHLEYERHPKPKGMSYLDSYQLTMIALFPDLEHKAVDTTAACSGILFNKDKYAPIVMTLPVPAGARAFVLCLKVEGCEQGVARNIAVNKGMRILKSGGL